jgi:hypothetical protein
MVIADTVIHLNICSCFGGLDQQTLVDQWAQRVEARSAASASAPVSTPTSVTTGSDGRADRFAQANLNAAAEVVQLVMRVHPDAPITRSDLVKAHSTFLWDTPGAPVGATNDLGSAVVSTYITPPPGSQYVVLALPGDRACYYIEIEARKPNHYGVASGSEAASSCTVGETSGHSPILPPDTKWSDHWPKV